MGRRQSDAERGRRALAVLFLMGTISLIMVDYCLFIVIRPGAIDISSASNLVDNGGSDVDLGSQQNEECCRGVDHLELWGDAVKWGSQYKFNSSEECCMACKRMCGDGYGRCLCDSWVFCGNRAACGAKFGECWLKKQKNTLDPDRRASGDQVMWSSGLIFGKEELFPACAPHSVNYILELLASRHCVGCQFYRAESRGSFWHSDGGHVKNAPYGPPFALIQGTLEAHGTIFKKIPKEECPIIRRGSVAWVGSGPEFFISLADHYEWQKAYTVFGSVLQEDMDIVEKIAQLPTRSEVWYNNNVSVLQKPIALRLQKMKTKPQNIKLNADSRGS